MSWKPADGEISVTDQFNTTTRSPLALVRRTAGPVASYANGELAADAVLPALSVQLPVTHVLAVLGAA
jgi:hypothetical protein